MDSKIKIPPLYEMEDYSTCINNNNFYCKVDGILNIPEDNADLFNYVKDIKKNLDLYDRTLIERLLCLTENQLNNKSVLNVLNKNLESYNLTGNLSQYFCISGQYTMSNLDKTILTLLTAYLIFLIFATVYDLLVQNKNYMSFLVNFSLYNNLKKRLTIPDTEDYNRMKCLQGFRVFMMMFVILGHFMMSMMNTFKERPEDFEWMTNLTFSKLCFDYGFYILTAFMVMSSWITLMQVKRMEVLTFKSVLIKIAYRYIRLASSLVIVLILSSTLLSFFRGPLNFTLFELMHSACVKNWIYNVLMVNNFHYITEICNMFSWYLSADFQLYIVNMIIIFIAIKYKLNELFLYIITLLLWTILYGSILYYNNEGPVFKSVLRYNRLDNVKALKTVVYTHTSTFANSGASAVGLIIGHFYLRYKKNPFKVTKIKTILWFIIFFGLPSFAVYLSKLEGISRLEAAVIGAVSKPMFAFGLGVGMLGMSFDIGGVVKRLFEFKVYQLLANFSFTTYISNIIITLTFISDKLPSLEPRKLFPDLFSVTVVSLALGVFATIAFEEPIRFLKQLLEPRRKIEEKKKKDS